MNYDTNEYALDVLNRALQKLKDDMLSMAEGYNNSYNLNVRQRRSLERTIRRLEHVNGDEV